MEERGERKAGKKGGRKGGRKVIRGLFGSSRHAAGGITRSADWGGGREG